MRSVSRSQGFLQALGKAAFSAVAVMAWSCSSGPAAATVSDIEAGGGVALETAASSAAVSGEEAIGAAQEAAGAAQEATAAAAYAAVDAAESASAEVATTAAEAGAKAVSEAAAVDLAITPPMAWLLAPSANPDAEAASAAQMRPYTENLTSRVTLEMVPIPGGTFLMGSPETEEGRDAAEGPQFQAQIEPLWMGKYEITWEQYELWGLGADLHRRQALGLSPSAYDKLADAVTRPTEPYSDMSFGMGKGNRPAVCMTQLAAKVFCKWLSAKTGRYYRLPTEAEWEYACRAGATTAYSFGDDAAPLGDYAWFADNSDEKYHPVGGKKPNAWGLYDMHGNVCEWVIGEWVQEGYARLAAAGPKNPVTVPGTMYPRVVRGGSFDDDPTWLRSAMRITSDISWMVQDPQIPKSVWYHTDANFVGFRVVRPLRVPTPEEAAKYDIDDVEKEALAEYKLFKGY